MDLLDKSLQEVLQSEGIDQLLPVQEQVFPLLVGCTRSKDICVSSPTGSGKTLAYVLPIVQNISQRLLNRVRVLVLVPTKDLVIQVRNVFRKFAAGSDLKAVGFTGGTSVKQEQKHFQSPDHSSSLVVPDILICTPDRLMEHFKLKTAIDLSTLEYLVLDEADQLFESDDNHWYQEIIARCHQNPSFRRNPVDLLERCEASFIPMIRLLFSATLTRNPAKFYSLGLSNPTIVNVHEEKYSLPPTLEQFCFIAKEHDKIAFLLHLLDESSEFKRVLCFTNSIKTTTKLSMILNRMKANAVGYFTGDRNIKERSILLDAFKRNKLKMLVCTDGVARGVDFENVDCVVNFDRPSLLKTYVHRAGRTARIGRPGVCISLLAPSEVGYFKFMLKSIADNHVAHFIVKNYEAMRQTAMEVEHFIASEVISQDEFMAKSFLLSQFHQ